MMQRECAAAFVVKEGKVLLGRRSAARSFYPNVWDVFGGHLETDESPEDALRRELREELGIELTEWRFLLTINEPDAAANGAGIYHLYLVTGYKGAPRNLQTEEHFSVEWFGFEEALKLPFAHPLYAELIARFAKHNR